MPQRAVHWQCSSAKFPLAGGTEFLPLVHTCADALHPSGVLQKWSLRRPRACEGANRPKVLPCRPPGLVQGQTPLNEGMTDGLNE